MTDVGRAANDHLQTLVAEVSASMDLAFLIIGLAALGLLAVGLLTGEMPNSVGNPTRQARPRMFWSLALVYGLIAGMSLIKAVASVS
jgi:hypothetical protein